MSTPDAADILSKYEQWLMEIYRRCRYRELISLRLMDQALQLERWVRWSVLGTLAIALLPGVWPSMLEVIPHWLWDAFAGLATLLGVFALLRDSGQLQFKWHKLALRFQALANKVEHLSVLVRLGKVPEGDLQAALDRYTEEEQNLTNDGGPEFLLFATKHHSELTADLDATMKSEDKIV